MDIASIASEYRNLIETGRLSAQAAAEQVNQLRNQIMELARLRSSPTGRAFAQRMKRHGRTLGELAEKYAQRLFHNSFESLGEAQQARVWLEIVNSAGRADPAVVALAQKLGKLGQRILVVSLAIAVYEINEAEDKPREAVRQGLLAGAGVAGGWAVGGAAVATGVCAATAPFCVGAAAIVGGILFAFGTDLAYGTFYPIPAGP
jgi:hypothetical protein